MPLKKFQDQIGSEIIINAIPRRIISIVPSQTELLFDLGLDDEIAGVTKFCVHPEDKIKTKVKVGGTKKLKHEVIKELDPDLIIGNKEENSKDDIEKLRKDYPVWISNIKNLEDACQMIKSVGKLTGKDERSSALVDKIQKEFKNLQKIKNPLRVLYLIWKKPYMSVGKDTFINFMLKKAGFRNVFEEKERYPEISESDLKRLKPELIMLSSEPYPFKTKHFMELNKICPEAEIILVDGQYFSWYGSRLKYAPGYLNELIDRLNARF